MTHFSHHGESNHEGYEADGSNEHFPSIATPYLIRENIGYGSDEAFNANKLEENGNNGWQTKSQNTKDSRPNIL